MSINYGKIFKVVRKIVKGAGNIIAKRNAAGRQKYIMKSGETDLVTETDEEIENILICELSEKFPSHKFISEERPTENKPLTDDPTWLIDPVDGTMNFVHSYPNSCISIALLVNKITEIGIVYNPVLEQFFSAIRGEGAYCNDRKICVSGETNIRTALLIAEICARNKDKFNVILENITNFSQCMHGIRATGSAAINLSMVALGGADAYYEMSIHHWDVVAGALLVREAGGVIIDPDGGPYNLMGRRILAASSMELACAVAENLTQYYVEPKDE